MQISKNIIFLVSALGIFSGCSEDPVTEQTQSSAIEKTSTNSKINNQVKTDRVEEFANFRDLSDKSLSRGFDIRPEGLSATVLRLGNVLLGTDGTMAIFPTPAYINGKLSPDTWRYETRFACARAFVYGEYKTNVGVQYPS